MSSRNDRQKKRTAGDVPPPPLTKKPRTKVPPARSNEPFAVATQLPPIPQQNPQASPSRPQKKVQKFSFPGASEWYKKFANKRELLVECDVDDTVEACLKVKKLFNEHKWGRMLNLPREFSPSLVYEFWANCRAKKLADFNKQIDKSAILSTVRARRFRSITSCCVYI